MEKEPGDMLYRRLSFGYGAKGKEIWETYGSYMTYDYLPKEYVEYLKALNEEQKDADFVEEMVKEKIVKEEEPEEQDNSEEKNEQDEIEEIFKDFPSVADYEASKKRFPNTKNLREDKEHNILPVKDASENDGEDYEEYREPHVIGVNENVLDRHIGTAMVEFLNFDIDEYREGEYEIEFAYEDDIGRTVPVDFKGWKKLDNHNISKKVNRHEVLYDFITGGSDGGPDEYTEQTVPFIIRMFSSFMIDFDKWEYNEEGIELIRKMQRKYADICDMYYGLGEYENDEDKRTAFEKYCDTCNLEYNSKESVRKSKKAVRGIVKQAIHYVDKKLWIESPVETEEGLEQVLLAEFYAMITEDHMFLKRCEGCGKFFLGGEKSKYCRSDSKIGILKDEDNKDFILQISQCSTVSTMENYNKMKAKNPISKVYFDEKKRLEHNGEFYRVNIENSGYNKLLTAFNGARWENEQKYLDMLAHAENGKKGEEIIEEYRMKLISAVNAKLEEISPKMFRERNFDRKRKRK